MKSILVLAIIFPAISISGRSQDAADPPAKERDFVKTFVSDEVKIWTSPFRGDSYTGHAFQKYVIPFTFITGALIATDRRTSEALPNTEDQTKWSLRVSQIGASYSLAGIAATMYVAGRLTGNSKAREAGFLGIEAIGHSQLVTLVLKEATQRTRPVNAVGNGIGGTGFYRGGDSFPSGHASGSFALATVFAYEYGHDHPWVPYASYGLASIVAASRLSGEKHWLSDLFVGSSTGFLIGRYVFKAHHDFRSDGRSRRSEILVPQLGATARSASLAWNW